VTTQASTRATTATPASTADSRTHTVAIALNELEIGTINAVKLAAVVEASVTGGTVTIADPSSLAVKFFSKDGKVLVEVGGLTAVDAKLVDDQKLAIATFVMAAVHGTASNREPVTTTTAATTTTDGASLRGTYTGKNPCPTVKYSKAGKKKGKSHKAPKGSKHQHLDFQDYGNFGYCCLEKNVPENLLAFATNDFKARTSRSSLIALVAGISGSVMISIAFASYARRRYLETLYFAERDEAGDDGSYSLPGN